MKKNLGLYLALCLLVGMVTIMPISSSQMGTLSPALVEGFNNTSINTYATDFRFMGAITDFANQFNLDSTTGTIKANWIAPRTIATNASYQDYKLSTFARFRADSAASPTQLSAALAIRQINFDKHLHETEVDGVAGSLGTDGIFFHLGYSKKMFLSIRQTNLTKTNIEIPLTVDLTTDFHRIEIEDFDNVIKLYIEKELIVTVTITGTTAVVTRAGASDVTVTDINVPRAGFIAYTNRAGSIWINNMIIFTETGADTEKLITGAGDINIDALTDMPINSSIRIEQSVECNYSGNLEPIVANGDYTLESVSPRGAITINGDEITTEDSSATATLVLKTDVGDKRYKINVLSPDDIEAYTVSMPTIAAGINTATLTPNSDFVGDYTAIGALYDGDRLIEAKSLTREQLLTNNQMSLTAPAVTDNCFAVFYTWDTIKSMKSLRKPVIAGLAKNITVNIENGASIKDSTIGDGTVSLDYNSAYVSGDKIIITPPEHEKYLIVDISDKIEPALVYIPNGKFEFTIPMSNATSAERYYDANAFTGSANIITARIPTNEELGAYRNLAYNTLDYRYAVEVTNPDAPQNGSLPLTSAAVNSDIVSYYPHAYANRVTRNTTMFEARNVIDGTKLNNVHGGYPYISWGAGKVDDAELVVYFGRTVNVNKVSLRLRADYNPDAANSGKPHDTYWESAVLEFSDGSTQAIMLKAPISGVDQTFSFADRNTEWVRLRSLKRFEDTWAALCEIEIYGKEAKFATTTKVTTPDYSAQQIKDVINLTNGYLQTNYPVGTMQSKGLIAASELESGWNVSTYHAGNTEAFNYTQNINFYNYEKQHAEAWGWKVNNDTITQNGDFYCISQAYIDMYSFKPLSTKLTSVIKNADAVVANQTTGYAWVDLLFMSMPVYTELSNITGDPKYNAANYNMFKKAKDNNAFYDTTDHLWYRDAKFIWGVGAPADAISPNGKKVFWSRGNGWAYAGITKTLIDLPRDSETNITYYNEYLDTFKEMSQALIECQTEGGYWNSNLADPLHYGGLETSGTASFIYGLAWGIRNGHLDYATYYPHLKKAWDCFVTNAISPEGKILYVQPGGDRPYRYADEQTAREKTQAYAFGLYLLAATQMLQLCEDYVPAAKVALPLDVPAPPVETLETGYYTGTVSSTSPETAGQQLNNRAEKLIDRKWVLNNGDQAASDGIRWAVEGYPKTATITLDKIISLRKLTVVPLGTRSYKYKIESSADGTNYTTIVDNTANTLSKGYFDHVLAAPVNAKYIKFTVTGCGVTTTWISIQELLLYQAN